MPFRRIIGDMTGEYENLGDLWVPKYVESEVRALVAALRAQRSMLMALLATSHLRRHP
jgi:hypothetical protein